MELDVTHAVVLEPGAGRKLERPELMVIESHRGADDPGVPAPPGIVHTFTNPGTSGARLLNMHSPDGGFLDFLRRPDRQN